MGYIQKSTVVGGTPELWISLTAENAESSEGGISKNHSFFLGVPGVLGG
jgi:hypothetical protein